MNLHSILKIHLFVQGNQVSQAAENKGGGGREREREVEKERNMENTKRREQ